MDKLKSIFSIISILKNVKHEHFAKVMVAFDKIKNEAELLEKIRAGVDILSVVVDYTPTETDDEIVDFVEKVVDGEDFEQLFEVVSHLFQSGNRLESIDNLALAALESDLEKRKTKLPWSVIITIGFEIYKLIREWQDEKKS
jgi:hypothetical protein